VESEKYSNLDNIKIFQLQVYLHSSCGLSHDESGHSLATTFGVGKQDLKSGYI
jgi:hypothetical protein